MPARSSNSKSTSDAIGLLKADHDKVKKLFKEFQRQQDKESDQEMERLAKQICQELTVHATVEEELFYPAVRDAIDDAELVDEAEVEHATVKDLVSQIESMSAAEDKYAAKVCVLGEYVNHHVEEEQNELFPKAKKAKLDLKELGTKIAARKEELKAEMGTDEEDAADMAARRSRSGRASPRSHASR